jgi:adenosylcobinamide-phosphate synthase
MGGQVAIPIGWPLAPDAAALAVAVAIDFKAGDPEYAFHPVRLIGRLLQAIESALRRAGADGYGGGITLFVLLASASLICVSIFVRGAFSLASWPGWAAHVFVLYSFLSLGDLLRHGRDIERAVERGALPDARLAVSKLVGRDTDPMDGAACRRAAVESLSENLTDGFTSPLFWYVIGGLPLLTLFKVVSTMDSMVGYKTPRYLRFGWCGARLDDVMNFLPARLTFCLLTATAAVMPGYSGRKAIRVGWSQRAILPGPNAGWSEATTAGAVQRKLVGPIWIHGQPVTDVWLGDPADPPLETDRDYRRASVFVTVSGIVAAFVAWVVLLFRT